MEVRRGFAALLCVALLGLAGCTDDESSADPGDPTSNAAPSATATESGEPSIPPEARGSDEASAKAFVRYYFNLLTAAMLDGDTKLLDAMSRASCGSCAALSKTFRQVYASGGRFETRGWTVERAFRGESTSTSAPDFFLRVRQSARSLYNGQGRLVDRQPSTKTGMHIVLRTMGGAWQVAELEVIR